MHYQHWVNFGKAITQIIFPPRCLVCDQFTDQTDSLCSQCWEELSFIRGQSCHRCGIPLPISDPITEKLTCINCEYHPPYYSSAQAVTYYGETSKKIIMPLKYADRELNKNFMAKLMRQYGHQLITESDIITPVPLYYWRQWKRRYNQAALLAKTIYSMEKNPNLIYKPNILKRVENTPKQGKLSFQQRRENVKSVFIISDNQAKEVQGKNILIIDDVFTSGATVNECSRILKKAGAHSVGVLTFSRVAQTESYKN